MQSNPTIRRVSNAALHLALAAVCALPCAGHAQQAATPDPATPPAQQDTTPHGKVLFQGHSPDAVEDTPPPAPETTPQPTAKPGVSSSQKRGQAATLRRRLTADPAATQPAAPVPPIAEPQVSTSAASGDGIDTPQRGAPILITAGDRATAAKFATADRTATVITATTLDLHLDTHTGDTEVRAQLTVQNTSTAPIQQVLLRISGALKWESAHAAGATLALTQYHLPDDLDHTGIATELVLTLPQPLAPGATLPLELFYAGTLSSDDQRLLNLGAPSSVALSTDWDTVSDTFTGLRGLGNVLWYPVTEPPASLRDAAAVPNTVEHSRIAHAAAPFALHLTVQYTGIRPEAAFFCGERQLLKPLVTGANDDNTTGGAVIATWNRIALGAHTPSLFIAQASPQTVANGLLRVVTDRADTAAALGEAAAHVRPMLSDWLGAAPLRALDVIDLPIPGASGFADGPLLVAPLTTAPASVLAPSIVGPLAATWLPADIAAPWLRDGIPAFLQAVWAERTEGRTAALNGLATTRTRLTTTEAPPQSAVSSSVDTPSGSTSQPLATCTDPACARAKAAYVLEMLRGMLGDAALQQSLSGWRVAMEKTPDASAAAETTAFETLLRQTAGKQNLNWFFADWIDADRGLPDLSIVTIAPRRVERNVPINYLPPKLAVGGPIGPEPVPKPGDPESQAKPSVTPGDKIAPAPGSWLVAVEVQNAGAADADVPVTVRSGGLTNTLRLHVPAHGRATIRVPFEADPEEVLVNDGSVPELRSSQHRRSINTNGH